MQLVAFDLDGTLLDGATEGHWSALLADEGLLDRTPFEAFRADYLAGRLDISAYNAWQNAPYAALELDHLLELRRRLLEERVLPNVPAGARRLLDTARAQADLLVLATAASDFLCQPIAEALGFDALVATRLEWRGGRPTGRLMGAPAYQSGKLEHLEALLAQRGTRLDALADSWFYSDSFNDLPLLERVRHPVAVEPDEALFHIARERGWPILRWSDPADSGSPPR
jgi:HAD superfamily hydrolase (TIGR01490 family)